jgi:hypothetical protein
MGDRRLLYLGPRQMDAWHWRRGTLTGEAAFLPTETGWRQFAHYLARNAGSRFTLLVNVADEGFQVETIPYLRGADRRRVIDRRLAQAFFDSPLTAAISLGHEKNRRKDERLLLTALGRPDSLLPWLDGLRAADAALSGIFSLPLLAPALFRKLRLPPEPRLLLSVQDQSLRQSFLDKGGLRFSRLTQLHESDGLDDIAPVFAAEAGKLQQYLSSQRLIERGQPLAAHVLAHPGAFETLRAACVDTPTLRFTLLDLTVCARRIGLETAPLDMRAERLFLHLLAVDPPGIQFAGEALRHRFHLVRIRSLFRGAGALTLAACLSLSGKYLFDAHRIAQDADALYKEAALARHRYEEIVGTFPKLPFDYDTLGKALDRYLAEERRGVLPGPFYREISHALQAVPAIEIDRLDWKAGGAESGAANAGDRPPPENAESITVRGRLQLDAEATPRQGLAAFGRFVDALRDGTKRQVEILQSPFDIASGKSSRADITSGTSSRADDAPEKERFQKEISHEFVLLVMRRRGEERGT